MSLALITSLESSGALTPTSLRLPATITLERAEAVGTMLGALEQTCRFAIGDYLVQTEKLFPEQASQLSESLGISEASRAQYVRVAERIAPGTRVPFPALSWSHHRLVAHLEPAQQSEWLLRAAAEGWTKREMEERMRPSNGTPAQGRRYVLEQVADVAERLLGRAERIQDGWWAIPPDVFEELREAVGE